MLAGAGLKPPHRSFRGARPHGAQMFLHDAVAALKAQPAQLFMQADGGQIRVAFQPLRDPIRIRVQQARPGIFSINRGWQHFFLDFSLRLP